MLQLDNGSCACSACGHYLALKELCHSSLVHFVSFANCRGRNLIFNREEKCDVTFPVQLSKLKFLLGCHLAANSFGLGKLLYKASRQLQNFRCHGDQNGPNLEGCHGSKFSGSQQSFLTKTAVKVRLKNGRKVRATILFQLAIMHWKVIHVHFRGFFSAINLQEHSLLRSRNLLPW